VADGVVFRVWAPNADSVSVIGDFNGWSKSATPLTHEGDGYWAGKVEKAKAGDEYKFFVKNGDQALERVDPYARQVTNSVGNGIIYDNGFPWQDNAFQMAPWHELVIYEMHIGTFLDDDQTDAQPGTFDEATERLPYLQSLGVNAIEIMPPMEFAGDLSWGYNPAHIFAVESIYGGPDAFKRFVDQAHAHGIAVILDVVYNHFGPSDLDLWRFDGWAENGYGGIYFYNDDRANTSWGDTRPDYGRPEVRQFIRDNALMWLEEYHLDGLRWDSTVNIRNRHGNDSDPVNDLPEGWGLMQWINTEIQERFPGKLTIAEDLMNNPWLTKTTGEGGAGFGAQWDAQFVHTIRGALMGSDDGFRDLDAVAKALTQQYNGDVTDRVIYTESHDEVANGKARLPEEITPGEADSWFAKKRSTLGAALVLTAPGIPMLFQGQEFLTDRWFEDTRPLDWSRADQYPGIVDFYRELIALRRNLAGRTAGLCGQQIAILHMDQNAKVLSYVRHRDQDAAGQVVVIANFANQTLTDYRLPFPEDGRWTVLLNSDEVKYDAAFTGKGSTVVQVDDRCGVIAIGPYSVLVLVQE
ncbi:MAG: alpha amylase C-terminal domain-containing protein, partial [Caldilineaceae bacterium]|nr:alpha amylase C-terminal domain-containing protein [Caldilineaceae bacterium]